MTKKDTNFLFNVLCMLTPALILKLAYVNEITWREGIIHLWLIVLAVCVLNESITKIDICTIIINSCNIVILTMILIIINLIAQQYSFTIETIVFFISFTVISPILYHFMNRY